MHRFLRLLSCSLAVLALAGCATTTPAPRSAPNAIRTIAIQRDASSGPPQSIGGAMPGVNYSQHGAAGAAAGALTANLLTAAILPQRILDAFERLRFVTAAHLPEEFQKAARSSALSAGGVAISGQIHPERADAVIRLSVPQGALGRTSPWDKEGYVMLTCRAELIQQGRVVKAWSAGVRDPDELGRINFNRFAADPQFASHVGNVCARRGSEQLMTKLSGYLGQRSR